MERTEIEIELLTPMYLGGAMKQPEFRIPSIKGLLRFWLRAIDPNYREWEPKVFGDAGDHGVSPFILRLASPYKRIRICHIMKQPEGSNSPKCLKRGVVPGLKYLAFPMGMGGGERDAISPRQRFRMETLSRRKKGAGITGRYSMAWWALTTIGGIGSRSRRGFGSVRVVDVDSSWKVMNIVRAQSEATSPKEWVNRCRFALKRIDKWFGKNHKDDHFHIGKGTKFALLGTGRGNRRGFGTWSAAMGSFGTRLKNIREQAKPEQKAAFGLPIDGLGLEVSAPNQDRGASPLMATVVYIDGNYYILLTFTKSPVCPDGTELEINEEGVEWESPPDRGMLEQFYSDLSTDAIYRWSVK